MCQSHLAIGILIATLIAFVDPNQEVARQQFSLRPHRNEPLWRNTTSRLQSRNPDAVSFHVDPNHNYAWTPVQLGGSSMINQSHCV